MTSNARELAQIPSTPSGRRNIVINGAMQVNQRGEQTGVGGGQTYSECDRFLFYGDDTPTFRVTLKQVEDGTDSETTPDGFPNALKVDVTTAQSSISSTQSARIIHKIEAQNLTHLQYGTSSAKTITMSFWVKSSTTGTYTFNFYAEDNARIVGATYTINAANTWEYKTLTFAGDTVDGINNDNGTGFWCQWFLASGSGLQSGTFATSWQDYTNADYVKTGQPNVMSSTSNDWYITGVQLEVGSVATEFEHRSFGEELALCQRYYYAAESDASGVPLMGYGFAYSTTVADFNFLLPVTMRAAPSITALRIRISLGSGTAYDATLDYSIGYQSGQSTNVRFGFSATGLTAYRPYFIRNRAGTGQSYIRFDAEL